MPIYTKEEIASQVDILREDAGALIEFLQSCVENMLVERNDLKTEQVLWRQNNTDLRIKNDVLEKDLRAVYEVVRIQAEKLDRGPVQYALDNEHNAAVEACAGVAESDWTPHLHSKAAGDAIAFEIKKLKR